MPHSYRRGIIRNVTASDVAALLRLVHIAATRAAARWFPSINIINNIMNHPLNVQAHARSRAHTGGARELRAPLASAKIRSFFLCLFPSSSRDTLAFFYLDSFFSFLFASSFLLFPILAYFLRCARDLIPSVTGSYISSR